MHMQKNIKKWNDKYQIQESIYLNRKGRGLQLALGTWEISAGFINISFG